MYGFNVEIANPGQEDEHQVVVVIRLITDDEDQKILDQKVMRIPTFFNENYSSSEGYVGFEDRAKFRFETTFDLSCQCESRNVCTWHEFLTDQWKQEDDDAIDSWRESRGDADAMLRRTRRMILHQTCYLI